MNGAYSFTVNYRAGIERLGREHPALFACIVLSIALHCALIWATRHSTVASWQLGAPFENWLTVTLQPARTLQPIPDAAPRPAPVPNLAPKRSAESASSPAARVPALNTPDAPGPRDPDNRDSRARDSSIPTRDIDLDAARRIARDTSRSRSGMVDQDLRNFEPTKPEYESAAQRALAKAARPDCRTAHAELGLLAIPFLLKDTLTDTGCKW